MNKPNKQNDPDIVCLTEMLIKNSSKFLIEGIYRSSNSNTSNNQFIDLFEIVGHMSLN